MTDQVTDTTDADALREQVREHYAKAAQTVLRGEGEANDCCHPGITCAEAGHEFGSARYESTERESLPEAALLASLGCGNPAAVAELREGEVVLDLGSGGGIDVLLSARRVGPTGKAYGLDMTEEMLALARRNAAEAGATNVEFLKGQIEAIPLPADTVDAIISNCVINLSVDKPAVFAEMFRVLKPGGRVGVSDIVAEDRLTRAERSERGTYVGCVAGALSVTEYVAGLEAVGFTDVSATFSDEPLDGVHSAIIKAAKPSTSTSDAEVAGLDGARQPAERRGCC